MRLNLEAIHNYRLPMDYIHCKTNDDPPRNYKPQNIMHQLELLLHAGTQGMLPEDKGRVVVVNALSLLTVFLASFIGTILFFASWDYGILIAAWAEALLFSGIILLNQKGHHLMACIAFLIFHNMAVLYFGIWRQMTKEEELLTVFLCITSAIIFKPFLHTVLAWLFCLLVIGAAVGVTRHGIVLGEPLEQKDLYSHFGLFAILVMTFCAIYLSKYYDVKLNQLISERNYKLHKYNRQLADLVEERTKNISEYAQTILHEVRNYLFSQISASETVSTYMKFSEDASKFEELEDPSRLKIIIRYLTRKFGVIYKISKSTKVVIDNTLDVHKIEKGRFFDMNIADVDLHSWTLEVGEVIQLIADRKAVTIELDYSAHLPEYVRTDGKLLYHAVSNLLINALDFSPEYSKIRLCVYPVETTSRQLCIEIEDQGPGMPADKINNIFEPFYTKKDGGTGLGLALVKSTITQLGGRIEVTSVIDKGSIFRIMIPLIEGSKKSEKTEMAVEIKEKRALRVLIAEDNGLNRTAFSGMVRKLGWAPITAKDGNDCIEQLILHRPDLLILDVFMGGANGIEALRRIRSMTDPHLSRIPIIIITGQGSEHLAKVLKSYHADAILHKPFEWDEFVGSINNALERAKLRFKDNATS